jgi:argininosuccinate lyase
LALRAIAIVVARMTVDRERVGAALRGGFLTATEVADYLVRGGVPFREAHGLAGQVVRAAEAAGCELWELPLGAYQQVSPHFAADILEAVTPDGAVRAKDVPGGTAPDRVAAAIRAAEALLAVQRSWLDQVATDQAAAEARLLTSAPG